MFLFIYIYWLRFLKIALFLILFYSILFLSRHLNALYLMLFIWMFLFIFIFMTVLIILFQCSSWILCLLALLCCMWSFWDTAQSLGLTASGDFVSANLKDNTSRELLQPGPYTTTYSHHAMSPRQLCLTSLWPFCTAASGLFYRCLTHEWACEREYMWQRSGQLPFCFLTALVVSSPHRDSQQKFTQCCVRPAEQSCAVSRQPPA